MKQQQNKESKNSNKMEGIQIKPGMNEEQIYKNLLGYLKKQGIEVVKK